LFFPGRHLGINGRNSGHRKQGLCIIHQPFAVAVTKPVHLGRLHGLQAPDSYLNTYIPVLFLYETVNPFHFLPLIGEAGDQGPYFFSGRLRDFITSFEQMLIYPPAVFLPIVEPAIHPLIPEIHRRNQHMRKKGTRRGRKRLDRKSTRLNSSHVKISYAVFCLKKKKKEKMRSS